MAKRRRRSGPSSNQHKAAKLPKAAETIGFTEADEAFFRAGESVSELPQTEELEDAEAEADRPGFWRRLFSRAA